MIRWARPGPASWLLLLALLAGCGTRTYPVHGQVVYPDGTPASDLAGYFIMFRSEEHKTSATGTIGPDGSFTMGTLAKEDGAMLGKQRVAIAPPPPEVDKPRPPARIPARYGSFDSSALEVDVKPETNRFTITVDRTRK